MSATKTFLFCLAFSLALSACSSMGGYKGAPNNQPTTIDIANSPGAIIKVYVGIPEQKTPSDNVAEVAEITSAVAALAAGASGSPEALSLWQKLKARFTKEDKPQPVTTPQTDIQTPDPNATPLGNDSKDFLVEELLDQLGGT